MLFHANDLLDQRIIESGGFVPSYTEGSISQSIFEIVEMVRWTLERRDIQIEC